MSQPQHVDLTFGIGYGNDIDKAQGVLEKLVAAPPLALADPAPVIQLNELADLSVNFMVRTVHLTQPVGSGSGA